MMGFVGASDGTHTQRVAGGVGLIGCKKNRTLHPATGYVL